MPTPDDSGPHDRHPPASSGALVSTFDASAPPVEPIEDSADDPIPDNALGTESDEELDLATEAEEAERPQHAALVTPEERKVRDLRLTHPSVEPRVTRRYIRVVPDKDMVKDLWHDTFLRAREAPDFPKPHESLFPGIYKHGTATRRRMMRAYLRRLEREVPLHHADRYAHADAPSHDPLPDSLEKHDGILRQYVADHPHEQKALEMEKRRVVEEEPVAAIAAAYGMEEDAVYQRLSRFKRQLRKLATDKTAWTVLVVLVLGSMLYRLRGQTRPEDMAHHEEKPPVTMPAVDPSATPEQLALRAVAQEEKAAALKACKESDWDECLKRVTLAVGDDPRMTEDAELQAAGRQAQAKIKARIGPAQPDPGWGK
jgi:DNA-directed RNA polymerase specialized sigma24 family protein